MKKCVQLIFSLFTVFFILMACSNTPGGGSSSGSSSSSSSSVNTSSSMSNSSSSLSSNLPSFTLTYNGNGALGNPPIDTNKYLQGQTIIVSNWGSLNSNGYVFLCWNTLANGNGLSYSIGSTILIGSSNIVLYARQGLEFSYSISGSNATITGFNGSLTNLVMPYIIIPPSLDGYTVTSIGSYAFAENNLPNISIPPSVTTIDDDAFYDCECLTNVILPSNGLISIGEATFCLCVNITGINIPYSLTTIGNYAFEGSGLTSVIIPSGIINFGIGVFELCLNLTNVTFSSGVTSIYTFEFDNDLSLETILIPSSVTNIEDMAFTSSGIKLIYDNAFIPPVINSSVFSFCSNSILVKVPDGGSPTYVSSYSNSWITYLLAGSIIEQQ